MISAIIILSITGFIISVYGIIIEQKLQHNSEYKAACDISHTISCTRPMLSPYGKIFGISNSLAAALYYLTIIACALCDQKQILLMIVSSGLIVTAIFAYILYIKLKALCLLCSFLYCINIALAYVVYVS
jgi:uncharacterized membrane protein